MRLKTAVMTLVVAMLLAVTASAQVVLKVNGVSISAGELAVAKYKVTSDTPALAGDAAKVTRAAVNGLIADVLLAQEASEAGILVTEKLVNQGLESVKAQLGGRAAFLDTLKKIGATADDVVQAATRRQLAKLYVTDKVAPTVNVREADAKAYYEAHNEDFRHFAQLKISGIFVNAPPGISEKADAEAKARATEAERRVLAGEDFGKVARDLSDDMSKGKGGELGWMDAGFVASTVPQLGDVSKLEPGDVSKVLRGKFGYWVFRVDATRPAGPVPYDEVKDVVLDRFREAKVKEATAAIVKERRAKATVEALDPAVKAAL
ncbi:MAG TPA: peptidyl-prolyl cis-trans isomerase [Thermoanaerobaculaceae bacterium]|nr:peptidyl-prolyl cis-trans isomerase [Thermoanaerobaculaceae bacterium]